MQIQCGPRSGVSIMERVSTSECAPGLNAPGMRHAKERPSRIVRVCERGTPPPHTQADISRRGQRGGMTEVTQSRERIRETNKDKGRNRAGWGLIKTRRESESK